MDLRLQLLDSFAARGADGRDYKVCAYERMAQDPSLNDGQERWLSTGVVEYRLHDGALVNGSADGAMHIAGSGVALQRR